MTSPQTATGQKLWASIFAQFSDEQQVSFDLFHKIWIVPDAVEFAIVGQQVFLQRRRLKVLLEADHLTETQMQCLDCHGPDLSMSTRELVEKIVIPVIERLVNDDPTFMRLRQTVDLVLLAQWYKHHMKGSLLGQVMVNQSKLDHRFVVDSRPVQFVYQRYTKAFFHRDARHIYEDYQPLTQRVIERRYSSGGLRLQWNEAINLNPYNLTNEPPENIRRVHVPLIFDGNVDHFDLDKYALIDLRGESEPLVWRWVFQNYQAAARQNSDAFQFIRIGFVGVDGDTRVVSLALPRTFFGNDQLISNDHRAIVLEYLAHRINDHMALHPVKSILFDSSSVMIMSDVKGRFIELYNTPTHEDAMSNATIYEHYWGQRDVEFVVSEMELVESEHNIQRIVYKDSVSRQQKALTMLVINIGQSFTKMAVVRINERGQHQVLSNAEQSIWKQATRPVSAAEDLSALINDVVRLKDKLLAGMREDDDAFTVDEIGLSLSFALPPGVTKLPALAAGFVSGLPDSVIKNQVPDFVDDLAEALGLSESIFPINDAEAWALAASRDVKNHADSTMLLVGFGTSMNAAVIKGSKIVVPGLPNKVVVEYNDQGFLHQGVNAKGMGSQHISMRGVANWLNRFEIDFKLTADENLFTELSKVYVETDHQYHSEIRKMVEGLGRNLATYIILLNDEHALTDVLLSGILFEDVFGSGIGASASRILIENGVNVEMSLIENQDVAQMGDLIGAAYYAAEKIKDSRSIVSMPDVLANVHGSQALWQGQMESGPHVRIDTKQQQDQFVAELMVDTIKRNNEANRKTLFILPTGSTPIGIYKEFSDMVGKNQLDLSHLYTVNMDEYYVGPAYQERQSSSWADNPQSYRQFMEENLFAALYSYGFQSDHSLFFDGNAADADNEVRRIDQMIDGWLETNAQVFDISLGGIGGDGHVAFNESIIPVAVSDLVQMSDEFKQLLRDFNEFYIEDIRAFDHIFDFFQERFRQREADDFKKYLLEAINRKRSESQLQTFSSDQVAVLADRLRQQTVTIYVKGLEDNLKTFDWIKGIIESMHSTLKVEFVDASYMFGTASRAVYLAMPTIIDNAIHFYWDDVDDQLSDITGRALTIGVGRYQQGRLQILAAYGSGKSPVIKKILLDSSTPLVPASRLRQNSLVFVLDETSSAEFNRHVTQDEMVWQWPNDSSVGGIDLAMDGDALNFDTALRYPVVKPAFVQIQGVERLLPNYEDMFMLKKTAR